MLETLYDTLFDNPAIGPDRECLMFEGKRFTFRELQRRVTRLANALKAEGVKKGDRIVVLLHNSNQFVEAFYAITCIGAIFVPLNWRLHPHEHAGLMKDCEPVAMISEREFIDSMERASSEVGGLRLAIATDIESGGGIFNYEDFLASGNSSALERAVSAGDDAGIVYTSGTTSLPKGAVLTHGNYLADHANVGTFAELDATSVNLQMSPLYHASCIHTFMHVTYGGRTVLMGKFEPGPALKLLQDENITYAFMVPTMIYAWLDFPDLANYDFGALRTIDYGAAPMSEVRLHEALRTLGYIFIHAYGMTETSSHASLLGKMEQTIAPGSVGRGLIHSEIRIVDNNGAPCAPGEIGEIVIRGPHVMSRYWRRPEATAETLVDGWLHSGDLGRTDANGYIYVVDRKRDMIISGGVNLYPRDIEEVIAAHPGVGEVAVFGIPDEKWGESIAACIVLRKGATATADDIVRFAGERMARFKIPKLIEFVSELPKNPSGKVLKRVLQDRHKAAMAV